MMFELAQRGPIRAKRLNWRPVREPSMRLRTLLAREPRGRARFPIPEAKRDQSRPPLVTQNPVALRSSGYALALALGGGALGIVAVTLTLTTPLPLALAAYLFANPSDEAGVLRIELSGFSGSYLSGYRVENARFIRGGTGEVSLSGVRFRPHVSHTEDGTRSLVLEELTAASASATIEAGASFDHGPPRGPASTPDLSTVTDQEAPSRFRVLAPEIDVGAFSIRVGDEIDPAGAARFLATGVVWNSRDGLTTAERVWLESESLAFDLHDVVALDRRLSIGPSFIREGRAKPFVPLRTLDGIRKR